MSDTYVHSYILVCIHTHVCVRVALCSYLPDLVILPSAIAITTHTSASLSGRTVQVTVMECSVLFSLGVTSVATASVTDGATGITYGRGQKKFASYIYVTL